MSATKFRKKPVEIEAQQYVDAESGTEIIQRIHDADGSAWMHCVDADRPDHGGHTILIRTLEGDMHATLGDWVIRGVQGEFYPCKPDIFEATYEEPTVAEVTYIDGTTARTDDDGVLILEPGPVTDEHRAAAAARFFTASEHGDVVALRTVIVELGAQIDARVPAGRNKALALTALEDVQMRGNRGLFAPEGLRQVSVRIRFTLDISRTPKPEPEGELLHEHRDNDTMVESQPGWPTTHRIGFAPAPEWQGDD